MYTLFVILIVIAAVLMIGIVLIQESKGGGLSSGFSSGNQIMGVRKTTDFVEKTTWALAAFMVVVSIACAWTAPKAGADSTVIQKMNTQTSTNLPGFGASEQKDAPAAPAAPAADAKAEAAPADAPAAEAPAADAQAEAAPAETPAEAPAADAEKK